MQLSILASLIILVSVVPIQQKNPEAGNQRETPVKVWCTGDDLFSQGMCQAYFDAFMASPHFDYLDEEQPGNLIVRIPENVGWKKVGKRTKITQSPTRVANALHVAVIHSRAVIVGQVHHRGEQGCSKSQSFGCVKFHSFNISISSPI